MDASLLTCSGASVGVSISTQRRMPSSMVFESKASEEVAVIGVPLPSEGFNYCHSGARASANPESLRLIISGFPDVQLHI
jgi:hypothetical protein